jgi:hypothetical protein
VEDTIRDHSEGEAATLLEGGSVAAEEGTIQRLTMEEGEAVGRRGRLCLEAGDVVVVR